MWQRGNGTCTSLDGIVRSQDLGLEPGQVVDSDPILFARDCDQNVLTFENLHLLESTSGDQLVNLALTRPIEKH